MTFSEPKFVGKRIEISREKNKISITIHQKIERWQEAVLLGWFAAWTYCGIIFTYALITAGDSSIRWVYGICVAVWLYFFIRIGLVILWRMGGKEIITIHPTAIHIKNAFWKRGKEQVFSMNNVFKFGVLKKSPTSFFAFLDDSFWVLGGERVGFSYSGRRIQFGKQVSEQEAGRIASVVQTALTDFSKASKKS
jgi:hypothetical protein